MNNKNNGKKSPQKKARKAADTLGGASGKARDAIYQRKKRMQEELGPIMGMTTYGKNGKKNGNKY